MTVPGSSSRCPTASCAACSTTITGSSCRRRGPTRSAWPSSPTTTSPPRRPRPPSTPSSATRGSPSSAWRRRPRGPVVPRRDGAGRDAPLRPPRRQRSRRLRRHRPRPQGVRRPQAHRARAGGRAGHLLRLVVGAHARLQGDADDAAARRLLRRPPRRALRERPAAGAQPVLDEHLPVVAARPPLPLRRPQRRDQHRAGQPELDAHPRGDARLDALCPASSGPSRSARPAPRTPPASTRCSSCSTSVAVPCTTPC